MKLKLFSHLIEHSRWANLQILDALENTPSDDSLGILAHIVTADQVYYERMTGRETWPLEFWPRLSLEQITDLIGNNHENYNRFLDTTPEEKLSNKVQYKNSKGTLYHSVISEMILHTGLHGQHHRGKSHG